MKKKQEEEEKEEDTWQVAGGRHAFGNSAIGNWFTVSSALGNRKQNSATSASVQHQSV